MNYTLKVVEVRKETSDTVTFCFKQPGLKKLKYFAGQYLSLILVINGRRYVRPYSFSSAPGFDSNLEITVKRVKNGIVSNHLLDMVSVGDSIEVMPPMGDFVFNSDNVYSDVYLWGVGSGITPLISITKFILHSGLPINVHLIYGNRTHESTIFAQTIVALEQQYPHRFKVYHFRTRLSVDQDSALIIEGRIEEKSAIKILATHPDHSNTSHYICGPSGLKDSVKRALYVLGIKEESIFSEEFELVKDPQQFLDIHTQNVIVKYSGKEYMLEVTKGKSILESALDANIDLPYSCQTGNCSTCKGRLISGETKMIGLSKTRNDLREDEYLLCCSHPLTENVYIEI